MHSRKKHQLLKLDRHIEKSRLIYESMNMTNSDARMDLVGGWYYYNDSQVSVVFSLKSAALTSSVFSFLSLFFFSFRNKLCCYFKTLGACAEFGELENS